MSPNPAEIPAEIGSGGGGPVRFPFRRPNWPSELPPFTLAANFQELVSELLSMRDRLHTLETQQLVLRLKPRPGVHEIPRISDFRRINWPNELPEGGEGGGGAEIVGPPHEIAEFPGPDFGRLLQDIQVILQRLGGLEATVQALSERVGALTK
jgi:hypothetical protein